MNKRERLEKTLQGEATDRVPVALWRHWPGDDQRAADLARATIDFQKTYDWDFVVVTPANTAFVTDYSLQSEWLGDLQGHRQIVKPVIRRSLQWTELRVLDPMRGELGKYLNAINLVEVALPEDTPVLAVLHSPLMQAAMLAEGTLMFQHMRTQADRLRTGLNTLTENLLTFLTALRRTTIAGVLYMMPNADYGVLSLEEYRSFGEPYDRKILEAVPSKWWLNMVHLGVGEAPMFDLAARYPAQVLNWVDGEPDLERAKTLSSGALWAGLNAQQHVHLGTPSIVQDAARSAVTRAGSRRLILGASSAVPTSAPLSNLRAVRDSVEGLF